MRVIVVLEDGFVSIDGEGFSELDLSFIPGTVHALQWYGDEGEIEYQDERGRATHNETITSLDQFVYFPQCYQLWQAAKAQHDAELAAQSQAVE